MHLPLYCLDKISVHQTLSWQIKRNIISSSASYPNIPDFIISCSENQDRGSMLINQMKGGKKYRSLERILNTSEE